MLRETIELLQTDDFHGVHEFIEIAKGKNKISTSWSDITNEVKRRLQWQLRK